ncbi:hypothetical protein [Xanthomonas campestris]|uniref:hypothetical protein n=1 Tax=Xanthomonas campestris TaxID=339 RepID=UPI0023667EB8|nr:hypothetical protein [Xanthomonas campestris]MEA9783970.1 hypothetical protein [Xanthomonas campestris pv. raphani]MEA9803864.1 hypothetical protein [Xanthomonas campestris pv. raphani]MEA9820105.1 hypothetical protein [Xanthomonas campestris pv. raphani]MEA9873135.1 hypothetical protein [Xanthomonas campestris pv. raphani]MEA9880934.1 hypothetical protein [Xanthomonas campestris pv. raphani]
MVIDANVMALYGKNGYKYKNLFSWVNCCGGLCISRALLNEYNRQGSPLVAALIDSLLKQGRCSFIKNSTLNSFSQDSNYHYSCNSQDIPVARTVFRSHRKLLVSIDAKIRDDVNNFPLVNGIKPSASVVPTTAALIASPGKACAVPAGH